MLGARPPRPTRHTNRVRSGSAAAILHVRLEPGRTPARAKTRWHRSFARSGSPAPRRGRDRRRRRLMSRKATRAPGACGNIIVGAAARRARPFTGRRQLLVLHRDWRLGRRLRLAGRGASARRLRGGRLVWSFFLSERRTALAAVPAGAGAATAMRGTVTWKAAAPVHRASHRGGGGAETRLRRGHRRGRAGRLRTRPCARPLPQRQRSRVISDSLNGRLHAGAAARSAPRAPAHTAHGGSRRGTGVQSVDGAAISG